MTEKESIKNQFLLKSYKGFKSRDSSVMKQKVSRGQLIKTENASAKKPSTAKGDVLYPKAFSENGSKKRKY